MNNKKRSSSLQKKVNTYSDDIVFIRQNDYRFIKEMGQGACGQTILLHDDIIDEFFVCKKYLPFSSDYKHVLFDNFKREIKLLYKVLHSNIVRIYNYHLFPAHYTGYILMEYINGEDIDSYLKKNPDKINDIFTQAISGFSYLEKNKILHRDIRPQNILITEEGHLKIIDFGFGKCIDISEDFDKSVTLNWWGESPLEFKNKRYDFKTELYFLGKLFEKIIIDNNIEQFGFIQVLADMCRKNPDERIPDFTEIEKKISNSKFEQLDFQENEIQIYRLFYNHLLTHISKIENNTKYTDDFDLIITKLEETYKCVMLEDMVPDAVSITRCFLSGSYYYKKEGFPVIILKRFLAILKNSSIEKKRIILLNIHTKLDSITRYDNKSPFDDIPF